MARGRDAGAYFARQMAAKHGEENVIFEAAVPWPAPPALPVGELHTDVELKTQRIAIEVKNSVWIDSMYDSSVLQLAGALHFGRDRFDSGLLVFMDHDYQITDEYPVFLTDELVEKVEAIAAAVVEAGKTGSVPDRICAKPADGRGRFCPFIEHCFADWVAPAPLVPGEIPTDVDLAALASEGWVIQRDLKAAKGSTEEHQARWDEWKAKMNEVQIPPGVELFAGSVKVKRIDVKGRETFSLAKARTAGVWGPGDEERFGPFTKIGEPSVRYDLTKTEGVPLDMGLDDDEVPF